MKKTFSFLGIMIMAMFLFGLSMLAVMVAVFEMPLDGFQIVKEFSNCKFSFGSLEGFYALKGMLGNEFSLAITPLLGLKKLSLDKGIYKQSQEEGKSVAQLLEKEDPTENYKGTNLEKLDAYERQLAAHDIVVNGKQASLVGEFFKTSSSSILFPEFINRNLQIGMIGGRRDATLSDVISTTSQVDTNSLKSIAVDMPNTDVKYKRVNENSSFPKVIFKIKDKSNSLSKIGIEINATYEALRRVKVDLLANTLQLIGLELSKDMVYEALDTLINGDGNSNPAEEIDAATSGAIVFADILNLYFAFKKYESEIFIGNSATIKKVLALADFRDPLIASELLTKGVLTTPFGNILKVNDGLPNGKLLAFNRKAGIEMLEERGASLVETDKVIDKQFEKTVISKVCGFSKIFADSAYVLDFT